MKRNLGPHRAAIELYSVYNRHGMRASGRSLCFCLREVPASKETRRRLIGLIRLFIPKGFYTITEGMSDATSKKVRKTVCLLIIEMTKP